MLNETILIDQLQSLKQAGTAFLDEEKQDTQWQRNLEALDSAMDVIYDYGRITKELTQLQRHFQIEAKPVFEYGAWLCPACRKRISEWHSFCHCCGKRLGWNGLSPGKDNHDRAKRGKGKRRDFRRF